MALLDRGDEDREGVGPSVHRAILAELGLQQGRLRVGEHVLLLGPGTGYAFTATVVRWG